MMPPDWSRDNVVYEVLMRALKVFGIVLFVGGLFVGTAIAGLFWVLDYFCGG